MGPNLSITFPHPRPAPNLRGLVQEFLGRHPRWYARLLRWSGRGNTEKQVYLAVVRPGDVIFDVGANCGYFTILFSHLVGPAGEVHAFEPVPTTFARLQQAVARECVHPNVHLNNQACLDQAGSSSIHLPGQDHGQASLRPHRQGSWTLATTVSCLSIPSLTLDHYERGQAARRLDLVKCDVEGAEWLVLQGMTSRLQQRLPLLLLEVCSDWTASFGYQPADLLRFLIDAGYDRFYRVGHGVQPLADVHSAAVGTQQSDNLLCAVSHKHQARLATLPRPDPIDP